MPSFIYAQFHAFPASSPPIARPGDGRQRANMASLKATHLFWRHDFRHQGQHQRIDQIWGLTGEIGLLSVDIDANDRWVWDACRDL
jgi:hypothetical protein